MTNRILFLSVFAKLESCPVADLLRRLNIPEQVQRSALRCEMC